MINESMQITGPVASCFSYGPIIAIIIDIIILLFGLWLIGKIDVSEHPVWYYIVFLACEIIITILIMYVIYMAVIG